MSNMRRFDPVLFRAAMQRANFTTERLAQAAGLSVSYTAHLRLGQVPSGAVRARIALALGLSELELWPAAGEADLPAAFSEVDLVGGRFGR